LQLKSWRPLTGILLGLGIPAAIVTEWHQPVWAIAWVVVCGTGVLVRRALVAPVQRRLDQAGDALDRAVGWWLSPYGRRYRHWVLEDKRNVELKGLGIAGPVPLELDDVYVDVALAYRPAHQVSGNPLDADVSRNSADRHSVSEFLYHNDPARLAVVGPPGCGKSTLLASIARHSAQGGPGCRRSLPVMVALRDLVAPDHAAKTAHSGALPGGGALPDVSQPGVTLPDVVRAVAHQAPEREPGGWWTHQLERGRCMILLDGLDEVAREEDRNAITTWVEQQISSYPGNDYVVTSRPRGFPEAVIRQASILTIRPFTAEQVRLFLRQWYLAEEQEQPHVAGRTSEAGRQTAQLRARTDAEDLLALLQASPALKPLTVNPLLLTMIAIVHKHDKKLPGSRAALYDRICRVMLSRRQDKGLLEVLPGEKQLALLSILACEMMRASLSRVSAEQALDILGPLPRGTSGPVPGAAFLDDISYRGLLIKTGPGYEFAHKTFQEYLAAWYIGNRGLATTLTGHLGDDWWNETVLFYVAIAGADDIVRACLRKPTVPALALAFDCEETGSDLDPALQKRLDEVRSQAFSEECDPEHRRLIAAVLARRLTRQTTMTSAGTQVCGRPVPADLYWLFLSDSHSAQRPGPPAPQPGIRRVTVAVPVYRAETFITWLNDVTAGSAQARFRLPTESELHDPAVADSLIPLLPDSVTGLWTQPPRGSTAPGLWALPGRTYQHVVTGEAILQAVASDTYNTEILVQVLAAAVLDAVLGTLIIVALHRQTAANVASLRKSTADIARIRAEARARHLGREFTSVFGKDRAADRQSSSIMRDAARTIARDFACAYEIIRASSRVLDLSMASGLDSSSTLHHGVHDLGAALASARDSAAGHPGTPAIDTATERAIDASLALVRETASMLDIDPASRGRITGTALNEKHWTAYGKHGPDREHVDWTVGRILSSSVVRLCEVPDVPLTWVSRGPLSRAWQQALSEARPVSKARGVFGERLASAAEISKATRVRASLDDPRVPTSRNSRSARPHYARQTAEWEPAEAASVLDGVITAPLSGLHPIADPQAAAVRALALGLAADGTRRDPTSTSVFQSLAATVTLLQQRARGQVQAGEALVLALT
jgi:NACHT domain